MCKYLFVESSGLFVNIREKTVKVIHFFSLQEVPPALCPESVVFERNMLKIHNIYDVAKTMICLITVFTVRF